MKKTRYTEDQIIGILREVEGGKVEFRGHNTDIRIRQIAAIA